MSDEYSLARETRMITFLFVRFFFSRTYSFFDSQRFSLFPGTAGHGLLKVSFVFNFPLNND